MSMVESGLTSGRRAEKRELVCPECGTINSVIFQELGGTITIFCKKCGEKIHLVFDRTVIDMELRARIQELLDYHDLYELSQSSSIPFKVLSMIRLKARSIVNDEIIQIAPFWMPRKKPIYIDIETVPKWDKVWLIGFLIDDEFIQLYAKDYDDEGRILTEFNEIISRYRDRFLVTWTGFDTRILRKRMEIHGLPQSYMNMLGHVDLKLKMRRCFIFPTRGYGLKRIGKFLRYPFKNPHLDKEICTLIRSRFLEERLKKIL